MADLTATTDDNTLQVARRRHRDHDPRRHHEEPARTAAVGRTARRSNTNVVCVYSAGHLKTGWFGRSRRNGTVDGFDAQGSTAAYNGANTARFAMASIAYAIAKRDERAISTFANGVTISNVFGNPKEL